jgi:predicted RNA binding protein YcfA (HicA-like mRNA interferase family)
MPVTARELERAIMKAGWFRVASKGGHRQYKHLSQAGRVTIPWHKNGKDDIPPGTEKNILNQAGL